MGIAPVIRDFTFETVATLQADGLDRPDWIFCNPPFNIAQSFFEAALKIARRGFAFLVRSYWLSGQERYNVIYRHHRPTSWCISRTRGDDRRCLGSRGTSATDYVWLIWIHGWVPQPPVWLRPGMQDTYTRTADMALASPARQSAVARGKSMRSARPQNRRLRDGPPKESRCSTHAGDRTTLAIVTDHAVLRYLERQHGLDVETIRASIRDICQPGIRYGASGVLSGKGKFVLQDGRVVTFLESFMHSRDLRSIARADTMARALPLFDRTELDAIRHQREELLRKLKRAGVDARTRIHREDQLRRLTARQIEIELRLGMGGLR